MSETSGRGLLLVGGGFLGSYLMMQWLQNPYNKIIVMDKMRKGTFFRHPLTKNYEDDSRVKYQWGSSGDPQQLEKYFKEGQIDCIVHTAAIADVPYAANNPRDTQITNVDNMRIFLDYIGQLGFKGKIVHTSSESVYAKKPEGTTEEEIPFKETDATEGHSIYGRSKLAQEEVCREMMQKYDLNLTIIRSATMYGAYARAEQVIPTFIKQVLEKKSITLFGDGKQTSRDFVHVSDTVQGILSILEADDSITKQEIFNLGSGRETYLLNLANSIKETCGQPSEPFDAKKGLPRPGFIPIQFKEFLPGEKGARMVLNIDKAKSKLKMKDRGGKLVEWEPEVDLVHGLKSTIYWMCTEVGYDPSELDEIERFLYPERFKGRTEENPRGFRA